MPRATQDTCRRVRACNVAIIATTRVKAHSRRSYDWSMGKLIQFRRPSEPEMMSLREILDGLEGDVGEFTRAAADAYREAAGRVVDGDRAGAAVARAKARAALAALAEAFDLLSATSELEAADG